MATVEERIAKAKEAAAAELAKLEAEKERLEKVAEFDQVLLGLREKKADLQAQIDEVKKERDALVPHRPRAKKEAGE